MAAHIGIAERHQSTVAVHNSIAMLDTNAAVADSRTVIASLSITIGNSKHRSGFLIAVRRRLSRCAGLTQRRG